MTGIPQPSEGRRPGRQVAVRVLGKVFPKLLPVLLPLLVLMSSCVDPGQTTTGSESAYKGGWVMGQNSDCSANLAFHEDGVFSHQIRVQTFGRSVLGASDGVYVQGSAGGGSGTSLGISASRTAQPQTLLYCIQWENAGKTSLPFESVLLDTGIDPSTLSYRQVAVPGEGWLWVGTDEFHQDRFALHLADDGVLRGFEIGTVAGFPLYHKFPPEYLIALKDYPSVSILNLPRESHREEIVGVEGGVLARRLLLKMNSASEVLISAQPGSPFPICEFSGYESQLFLTPLDPDPMAGSGDGTPVPLNPLDPAQSFHTVALFSGDEAELGYFFPLGIHTPASGDCSYAIRSRAMAVAFLEPQLALPLEDNPIALTLGEGPRFVLAALDSAPGEWIPLPLAGHASAGEGVFLKPEVFRMPLLSPDSAARELDTLGLFTSESAAVELSVTRDGEEKLLNIFPSGSGAPGLGPFKEYTDFTVTAPALEISFPFDSAGESLAGPAGNRYRFTLPGPGRIDIMSSGLETAGRLMDRYGITVVSARSGSTAGPGFRILRTLPAGTFDLWVTPLQSAGKFALALAPGPAALIIDEALETCLIAAGGLPSGSPLMRRVTCIGKGVQSLAGLEYFPGLTHLILDSNGISDLTALGGLSRLHGLSLADNPVGDLSPLTLLPVLNRLSLARTTLTADDLAVLAVMEDRLALLVLEGVEGLTEADLSTLQASLPFTVIVSPAGSMLP